MGTYGWGVRLETQAKPKPFVHADYKGWHVYEFQEMTGEKPYYATFYQNNKLIALKAASLPMLHERIVGWWACKEEAS